MQKPKHRTSSDPPTELVSPALAALGLTDSELAALRAQGFVSCDPRPNKKPAFKLRFRYRGRQRVVYIGTDAARGDAIQAGLAQWQHRRRNALECSHIVRAAGETLRAIKKQLVGHLAAAGYRFHGREIRMRRNQETTTNHLS